MSKDPYSRSDFLLDTYWAKVPILGNLVVVLQGYLPDRELSLINPKSRALLKGEIHELILTNEIEAGPGQTVNNIAYVGFVEIEQGGVAVVGDKIVINGQNMGTVAGFDITHMPNHLNIVLKSSQLLSGADSDFKLRNKVEIFTERGC